MSTSDKKEYALATSPVRSRLRRNVATRDFSLPKPYRRKAMPEEQPTTSKTALAMWAVAGLLMAGLIAELTSLAQENLRQRRLPIIAAAPAPLLPAPAAVMPTAPQPSAPLVVAAVAAGVVSAPVLAQLDDEGPRLAAIGEPAPVSLLALPPPLRVPLMQKKGKLRGPLALETADEPDPDVVLITAILLLSPHLQWDVPSPSPVCTPGAPNDPACTELHGMRP